MVHAVIEPSKDGYGLYFITPSLDGITTFGVTLDKVKENAKTVLKELVEVYNENNETIPEELVGVNIDKLNIKFSFDLRYYFEHYTYLNLTEFAKKINTRYIIYFFYGSVFSKWHRILVCKTATNK